MSLSIGVSTFNEQHFASSATTGAVTPQTSGSTFALFVTGGAISSISDSVGNTYTQRAVFTVNGGSRNAYWYDCQNATGASNMTWTYTATGSGGLSIFVVEIATGAGSGIYPTVDASATTSSSNTLTGPAVTAAGSNEVAVSCIFAAGNGTASTINDTAGWNTLLQSITDNSQYFIGALSALAISSAGSYNDAYAGTNLGSSSGLITVTYKAGGGVALPFWGQICT